MRNAGFGSPAEAMRPGQFCVLAQESAFLSTLGELDAHKGQSSEAGSGSQT